MEIADLLERATGAEVKVHGDAQGRYRAELLFESAEDAHRLAGRLGQAAGDSRPNG